MLKNLIPQRQPKTVRINVRYTEYNARYNCSLDAQGGHIPRRIVTVLILVAFMGKLPTLGQSHIENPANSVSAKAQHLAATGESEQAIELLKTELQLHPKELEPRITLAGIYRERGDLALAEDEFRQALMGHADSDEAALALGRFYINTGSLGKAEQVLTDAVRGHPQSSETRLELTVALAGEHKYADAVRNLSLVPVPTVSAEQTRYYRLAASIHSGIGDKKAAARDMEKALAVTPNDPQLPMLTALTEADALDWNDCAPKLESLFAKNPTAKLGLLLLQAQLAIHQDFIPTLKALRSLSLPEAHVLLLSLRSAELLAQAEQHEEAAQEFERALTLGGADSNIVYNLAVEQYEAGELAPALRQLNSLRQNADSAEIEDLMAEIEEQMGDSSAAVRDHENAVKLAPSEERYRLSLGSALLRSQAYQPAEEVFQESIEAFPTSSRSYVGLALATYMLGQYEQSAAAFLRAEQFENNSERILNYLGSTQVENPSGPSEQAIHALCSRADTDPHNTVAAEWCGALLFRKAYLDGDQAESKSAITRLRAATALAPKDPVSYCFLGRALFWDREPTEARRWLETCVRMKPESPEEHYRLSLVYGELNLKQAASQQAALADSLKSKADQSATRNTPDLEAFSTPTHPTLHIPPDAEPAAQSPQY
jgi:tetratricopeptide (TPR) repeat protein